MQTSFTAVHVTAVCAVAAGALAGEIFLLSSLEFLRQRWARDDANLQQHSTARDVLSAQIDAVCSGHAM